MKYPNRLQACLVFDERIDVLEAAVRDFAKIEEMKSGATFNVPESNPGRFYRLFGGGEIGLSFEYIEGPANPEAFRGALSSAVTGMLCPDIRQRLERSRSHILLEVSHGVLGGVEELPQIAAMFEQIGRRREGASQSEFERRLELLALMSRITSDHASPSVVHWTQSDQLLPGELFENYATGGVPGPLHIHPYLFGPRPGPGEEPRAGIRTFGARHWIGREILVEPSVLPWAANYETILAFLRVCTMENGYVIPDGDTFGPEDRSLSYRVTWHEAGETEDDLTAEEGGVPLYKLTPLKHVEYGFVSDEHVPDGNVIDDRAYPADLMPEDQDEKMEEANRWRESRKLAEGAGAQFEVRARNIGPDDGPPEPPAPPPPQVSAPTPSNPGLPTLSGRGLRAKVFGRKQA
ncbi:hypothetical protein [Erythrobacter sp. JK5]|uniref:hypothetical protein n=1 Tax=Erythrobacter sp. JK5 TaxID=2829500 RepID=UPI001BAC3959|nr:hypothetical protein [Erythrobacter sp. JK5]QUL37895.1 hypothetical protein KDC96_00180 [Erythrobacter sp. JK5]